MVDRRMRSPPGPSIFWVVAGLGGFLTGGAVKAFGGWVGLVAFLVSFAGLFAAGVWTIRNGGRI